VRIDTRRLAAMALLIALSVVLTRFASVRLPIGGVEALRIGFGSLPIVLAGLMMGAGNGALVGAVADVIGFMLWPMGPYMPHFTLASALKGAVPAAVMKLKRGSTQSTPDLFLSIAVGHALVSLLLVPYFLQQLFGIPMAATVPGRSFVALFQVPVYVLFTRLITSRVNVARELRELSR